MKISIAMATYNGARYIEEQLKSFAIQTRLPDEVIVCDDVSNDDTIDILEEFAETSPFKMEIVRNERNLGFTRNFEKALSLCSGDLIFLSDQDDVWDKEKLSVVTSALVDRPNVNLIINDAMYTDENLVPAGVTVLQKVLKFDGKKDAHLVGCSTAITKRFREFLLPFPESCPPYDVYIHRWAMLLNTKLVIPDVLQIWRIHGKNSSDSEMSQLASVSVLELYKKYRNANAFSEYIKAVNEFREMDSLIMIRREALARLLPRLNIEKPRRQIDRIIDANISRYRLYGANWFKRKILVIWMAANGKYKYFHGLKSIAKDIIR